MDDVTADAYDFLRRSGAPARLLQHARLVEEVAEELVRALTGLGIRIDRRTVLLGAVLHDCGKIGHPEELRNPGSRHEEAGRDLLLTAGYPERLAEMCVTHAQWRLSQCSVEDLVVALADKLWKGKREDELEALLIERVAAALGREQWEVFHELDTSFEALASRGHERLLRSQGGA
jgi:putative nucleotidyltransferase with HDIG domain